jgi:hypothetical protein
MIDDHCIIVGTRQVPRPPVPPNRAVPTPPNRPPPKTNFELANENASHSSQMQSQQATSPTLQPKPKPLPQPQARPVQARPPNPMPRQSVTNQPTPSPGRPTPARPVRPPVPTRSRPPGATQPIATSQPGSAQQPPLPPKPASPSALPTRRTQVGNGTVPARPGVPSRTPPAVTSRPIPAPSNPQPIGRINSVAFEQIPIMGMPHPSATQHVTPSSPPPQAPAPIYNHPTPVPATTMQSVPPAASAPPAASNQSVVNVNGPTSQHPLPMYHGNMIPIQRNESLDEDSPKSDKKSKSNKEKAGPMSKLKTLFKKEKERM